MRSFLRPANPNVPLKTHMARALLKNGIAVGAFLISYFFTQLLMPTAIFGMDTAPQEAAPPHAPSRIEVDEAIAAKLMKKHDCWRDGGGQGLPGHVLIQTPKGPQVKGAKITGQAMEQIFNQKDFGLEVLAFCK